MTKKIVDLDGKNYVLDMNVGMLEEKNIRNLKEGDKTKDDCALRLSIWVQKRTYLAQIGKIKVNQKEVYPKEEELYRDQLASINYSIKRDRVIEVSMFPLGVVINNLTSKTCHVQVVSRMYLRNRHSESNWRKIIYSFFIEKK